MKDFGNSSLAQGVAVAVVILALLLGVSLIVKSCSDAAAACAQAGGSYNGGDGSCEVDR